MLYYLDIMHLFIPQGLIVTFIINECLNLLLKIVLNMQKRAVKTSSTKFSYCIPEGELSLTHTTKSSRKNFPISQKYSSHWPGALMSLFPHLGEASLNNNKKITYLCKTTTWVKDWHLTWCNEKIKNRTYLSLTFSA